MASRSGRGVCTTGSDCGSVDRMSVDRATMWSMSAQRPSLLAEVERDLLDGKPLADLLRKCVILGGRSGSHELRAWASKELRGYSDDDGLPEYRKVWASIQLDAVSSTYQIKGQTLGEDSLPDFVRDAGIGNQVKLFQGVGELEASITSGQDVVRISLPKADLIARYIDGQSGNPWQRIDRIYWSLAPSSIVGVLDRVRTVLAEMVAEMSAAVPDDATEPSVVQADNAVQVAVHGSKARVTVTSANASGGSTTSVGQATTDDASDPAWWTFGSRVWAVVAGLVIVAGAIAAIIAIT